MTWLKLKECEAIAKDRAAILKVVAKFECNQVQQEPIKPQPGPSEESNGASQCVSMKPIWDRSTVKEEIPV